MFTKFWQRLLALSRPVQIAIVVVVVVVIGGVIVLARGKSDAAASNVIPTVTLESIGAFGGNSDGVDVLGTVQSVSEADLLAQSGGTVEAIHTTLGATVPAGFVIADLDSSSASASVLQAQGAYDAALAAQKATNLQAGNSTQSVADAQAAIETAYQNAYTATSNAINNDAYVFFGDNTPVGPELEIQPGTSGDTLPRELRAVNDMLADWEGSEATVDSTDPLTLLSTEEAYLTQVSQFLSDLSDVANTQGSGATSDQLASLAAAQTTVNNLLAGVTTSRASYSAAVTASEVSATQASGNTTGVTSSEASVEEALGGLRAAQAAYEKTVIRAPIAGTINYLPIHVGDYVTANQHVSTVARNNALEVVMELSQDDSNRLGVGDTLTIQGTFKGVVTTIAPALDPTTKQIEVDVAVNDNSDGSTPDLVNGQSVQVALPAATAADDKGTANSSASGSADGTSGAPAASTSTPNIELPLTAVKLLPAERDVFTVDSTGHLVAHQVQIGNVIGDLIQITTPLSADLEIVTDARGLSAGDAVLVSTSTPVSSAADDSSQ
jgi:multidrug efflux pump subunit AcrA (membrane-fusion protein)